MGHSGWSNDEPLILTLPGGATSGARIVIDGTRDAIFIYNSAGVLVGSIAATSGTDGAGNPYDAGFTVYYDTGSGITLWNVQPLVLEFLSHDQASGIDLQNAFPLIDAIYINAFKSGATGTATLAPVAGSGVTNWCGSDTVAIQPGGGNPFAAESWHGISGGIGYSNGWSDFGSGYQAGRYRKEPTGTAGVVCLDGMIKPGTYVNGTTILTMPVGYRPTAKHRWVLQADSATTGANMLELDLATTGVLQVLSIQGAAPGFVELTGIRYPLD